VKTPQACKSFMEMEGNNPEPFPCGGVFPRLLRATTIIPRGENENAY
jgi:hypothetical protein